MNYLILIRFGDLTLKGKNKKYFIDSLYSDCRERLKEYNTILEKHHDRFYLSTNEDFNVIKNILNKIPGIKSFSRVYKVESNIDEINKLSVDLLEKSIKSNTTFKVETKRSNKKFPLTSMDVSKEVSRFILKNNNLNKYLTVDVHNPKILLNINVKDNYTYLYFDNEKGLNGFPSNTMGKGLLLISGGIDSPVAGFLSIKQGIELELIHFESTPMTSIESAQKVIDLTKKLALYAKKQRIKLHLVPFKNIHEELLLKINQSYNINIMRRTMYKIASIIADKNNIIPLINGESLGQVASQTLESMNTINNVTNKVVLRPLITYDKEDIIKISRQIDTYGISIKPFEDCCTIYVPKNPVIKPKIEDSLLEESKINLDELINEAVEKTISIYIDKNSSLDLTLEGFEVSEILGK